MKSETKESLKGYLLLVVFLGVVLLIAHIAFAATFTYTYDTATPVGTDAPSVLDDHHRLTKNALQERLAIEHNFAKTGSEVSAANTGTHTAITCDSLTSTGDLTVNTDKFTVTAASGNTLVAGTLNVTGIMTTTAASVLGDGSTLAAATESGDGDRTVTDLNYTKTGDTAMHDAEGGFSNCDVDGTKTKVYTLYLTSTLDNDASTSVAHGRADVDKILAINVTVWNDNLSQYQHYDYYDNASADTNAGYYVTFDATNVIIQGVGAHVQGNNYRIKIDYIL